MIVGHFDPFRWAADPDRRTDVHADGADLDTDGRIRGFPGSAGVVEGTVRVIPDVAEGAELGPGEVLVTTLTNVGWTPLFPRAGAVVTDVGAPLSHAAMWPVSSASRRSWAAGTQPRYSRPVTGYGWTVQQAWSNGYRWRVSESGEC